MNNLQVSLAALQSFYTLADKRSERVSQADVGWHIEHSFLVIIRMVEFVSHSDPFEYQWQFNFKRTLIFLLNKFPRGKGEAPEAVKPHPTDRKNLEQLYTQVEAAMEKLKRATPNQYYLHSVFGKLNKSAVHKLLSIHTRHHLSIIRDIISASSFR